MHKLSRTQREKITHFRNITSASEKIAVECLSASRWDLEGGINCFYSSARSAPAANISAIEDMFKRYKDPHDAIILAEGVSQFCDDLEVDPSDIVLLVVSWHMNAAAMCEFTRDEFVNGLAALGCDSLEKLKAKLPSLRSELHDDAKFREIYIYAFNFSREKGQKCLQLETALGMWQLLFTERPWALLADWSEFLQTHHNRAISKDTWTQLLDFVKAIDDDFSNFDENGAWPYLIDEFVDHMKEKNRR
mmetsp:Transcript_28788/g.81081  ORF Transcript_28788/g.81081 Transcript_28788/m.81081 type:complete len:248 (-) Transcript_28788:139-882(-)